MLIGFEPGKDLCKRVSGSTSWKKNNTLINM